jgi:hypothetical protein
LYYLNLSKSKTQKESRQPNSRTRRLTAIIQKGKEISKMKITKIIATVAFVAIFGLTSTVAFASGNLSKLVKAQTPEASNASGKTAKKPKKHHWWNRTKKPKTEKTMPKNK